jgi:hypothetical protein
MIGQLVGAARLAAHTLSFREASRLGRRAGVAGAHDNSLSESKLGKILAPAMGSWSVAVWPQLSGSFVHDCESLSAVEGVGVVDGGHGLAELLGQREASHDERLRERGERLVERDERLVEGGHGQRGDVGPVLWRSRPVERQDEADVGGRREPPAQPRVG